MPPLLILAVVGLLCGFATIALVWLSERGCERFRDTTNCGALGLPLLVLIVVVTMVLGGLTLSRLAMPNPRLVAFLGVAFMLRRRTRLPDRTPGSRRGPWPSSRS